MHNLRATVYCVEESLAREFILRDVSEALSEGGRVYGAVGEWLRAYLGERFAVRDICIDACTLRGLSTLYAVLKGRVTVMGYAVQASFFSRLNEKLAVLSYEDPGNAEIYGLLSSLKDAGVTFKERCAEEDLAVHLLESFPRIRRYLPLLLAAKSHVHRACLLLQLACSEVDAFSEVYSAVDNARWIVYIEDSCVVPYNPRFRIVLQPHRCSLRGAPRNLMEKLSKVDPFSVVRVEGTETAKLK
ncbi:hypothetical protein [Thermofilum pendens]|uniref:Uncharacterized protein n=1 Tax=Thermofilum pendens (strain DSM 2475 / Hrk 5) TaxID=368408 RepID=A1RWV5_THEPD|nr:hypothetical protein [Thermofilum pendens]ABL77685.1 hypothetical protein Tpen_0275 [Thermofilum pendens Hrk 5]